MVIRNKTIALTGHRPSKLPNGWDGPHDEVRLFLQKRIARDNEICKVISGGALGWDQIGIEAAKYAGADVLLAEPFLYFWRKWQPHQIDKYMWMKYDLLGEDDKIVQVNSDEEYQAWKLFARNEYMVDRADEVWAWWDGTRKGGTYSGLQYDHKNFQISQIDHANIVLLANDRTAGNSSDHKKIAKQSCS